MIFYAFLGVVALVVIVLFTRSAMFKQLRRGNGMDASQWGDARDHMIDRGGEPSGRYDGGGGFKASRRVSKFMKPRH